MKAFIVLLVLASVAVAEPQHEPLDPKLSTHVKLAEEAWTAGHWEVAATEFALVEGDPVGPDVKLKAAASAMAAWQSAIAAAPSHAEQERLLVASTTLYRRLIDTYPSADIGGFAANLLLDAYNRLQRWEDLTAAINELRANTALLKAHKDLEAVLDKVHRGVLRKNAETIEAEARTYKELAAYTRAGDAFLAIYNDDPAANDNDEVLYNAGVSYEEGAAITSALAAYGLLQKYFPNSRLTMKAVARTGKLYGDIAMFDRAADKLEEYATKYAGEKDAYDAMSDAVYYRMANGNRAKAIADTNYIIKTFGTRKPDVAARAMFSLTRYYDDDPDALVKHLREYIAKFGSKGGSLPLVIAHARLGQTLFKQSCSVKGLDGLCVRVNESVARTCGTGTTRTLTTVPRDEVKLKAAMVELQAALKVYSHVDPYEDDHGTAGYFAAQARLAEGDIELEKYIAEGFPATLDFAPANRDRSAKQFQSWLQDKNRHGESVTRKYEAVLAMKDPATSITAAERLALVTQTFATQLVTSKPAPRADLHLSRRPLAAFCAEVSVPAAPLEERTLQAFRVCLEKAVELSWFAESAQLCERELIGLDPALFPPMRERHATAGATAVLIAVEPPLGPH